jgi:hypothetical protein
MKSRRETFGQMSLPGVGEGTARTFQPPANVAAGVQNYAEQMGRKVRVAGLGTLQQNPRLAHASFLERRQQSGRPLTAATMRSYAALREETAAQFAHMTKPTKQGGMGLKFEVTDTDPYANAEELAADVGKGRIKVLSTESTGGHGYFTNLENDQFRAVHDVYGHVATGRGFSRHGEEASYQHHAQLFSPEARPALASELRSQTAHLIETGEFPPNEPVNLPETGGIVKPRQGM